MKLLKSIAEFIDRSNNAIGSAVSWLTMLLVAVVSFDVITRYILNQSMVAVQELEWHLFAMIFLIGAASTLNHNKHVRVDVIYSRLSERHKAWIDLLGSFFFLIPFAALVIYSSHKFVFDSFIIREQSPNPGGLPARFLLKAMIPFGFVLLLFQGFSITIKSLSKIAAHGD